MQEALQEVITGIQANALPPLAIAFVAGFLATRFVANERRPGLIGFTIIGCLGAFLGLFAIVYFNFSETLDALQGLRLFIELLAAFVGSFIVAGIIHFVRPN